MTDPEDDVLEGLYRLMKADWKRLQTARRTVRETQDRLRSLIAQALTLGAAKRGIQHRTGIPEANVRRWAEQAQPGDETAGAA